MRSHKQIDRERHRLVFVGRRSWAVGDLLHEIGTNPLTRDTIVILHDVSDKRLASLYHSGCRLRKPLATESPASAAMQERFLRLVAALIGRLMLPLAERKAWEDRINKHYLPTTWDHAAAIFSNAITAFGHGGAGIYSGKDLRRPAVRTTDLGLAQVAATKRIENHARDGFLYYNFVRGG